MDLLPEDHRALLQDLGAKHFTGLSDAILIRFGGVFDTPRTRPAGLLDATPDEQVAIASQIMQEFKSMSASDRSDNFQFVNYVTAHSSGLTVIA